MSHVKSLNVNFRNLQVTYNWPAHTGQQQSIQVRKKPCDVSICLSLSLNWTLNPRSLPGVLLLAGPVLTLTPHSQIHRWISVDSAEEEEKERNTFYHSWVFLTPSPCISHFLPTSTFSNFLVFCALLINLSRTSLFIYSRQTSGWVGVFCPLTDNYIPATVFLFLIPLSLLIWEGRGRLGGRKEKVENRERERDER